jgi:hypothetical protein
MALNHRSNSSSSNSLDVTSLSVDQLECLCLVLENCDNFSGLVCSGKTNGEGNWPKQYKSGIFQTAMERNQNSGQDFPELGVEKMIYTKVRICHNPPS